MTCDEYQKAMIDPAILIDDDLAETMNAHSASCYFCRAEDERVASQVKAWLDEALPAPHRRLLGEFME